MAPKVNAINVGPASFIILRRLALKSKRGIAIGTRYDQTILYEGASVGIIEKLERIKVASIVITTAETFDPHFVFSAKRPNAAAIKSIAQRSQCWSDEMRVESNKILTFS
jgi:hypothetical protein